MLFYIKLLIFYTWILPLDPPETLFKHHLICNFFQLYLFMLLFLICLG